MKTTSPFRILKITGTGVSFILKMFQKQPQLLGVPLIIRFLLKKPLNQRLLTKSKINCPTPLVHTSERMGFFLKMRGEIILELLAKK